MTTERKQARLIGWEPAGLTKTAAEAVRRSILKAYADNGKVVQLESIQFIPSSRTKLDDHAFQVVANTMINVATGGTSRSELVDSVVTVREDGGETRTEAVYIPTLGRSAS